MMKRKENTKLFIIFNCIFLIDIFQFQSETHLCTTHGPVVAMCKSIKVGKQTFCERYSTPTKRSNTSPPVHIVKSIRLLHGKGLDDA